MAEFEHIKPIIERVIENLKLKAENYKLREIGAEPVNKNQRPSALEKYEMSLD